MRGVTSKRKIRELAIITILTNTTQRQIRKRKRAGKDYTRLPVINLSPLSLLNSVFRSTRAVAIVNTVHF